MCGQHWRELPSKVKSAILREYRKGQEIDKVVSLRYCAVQRWAIGASLFKPNDEKAALAAAPYLHLAEAWRACAIDKGMGDPLDGLSTQPVMDVDAARRLAK